MPETYEIPCPCGHRLPVQLFQAGELLSCPICNAKVLVPNTTILKESSGDPYPLLPPIEKICLTLKKKEPPFTGICHGCHQAKARLVIPIVLKGLVERIVPDEGGIRPTPFGIVLVVGGTEEEWRSLRIPLLLCDGCFCEFKAQSLRAAIWKSLNRLILVGLLAAFLALAWYNLEAVAALSGVFVFFAFIARLVGFRNQNKYNPVALKWIQKIRWVADAIAAHPEIKIDAEKVQLILEEPSQQS